MVASLFLLAALTAAPFGAATADTADPDGTDPAVTQLAEDVDIGEIVLSELERRLIRSYYADRYHTWVYQGGGKNKQIPPGLAKKGWLPPGIYKQLVAGQRVPGDVVLYPLPHDLRSQLPYRAGYDYYIADDKMLLVRVATNLILDVLTVAAIEALD
jgi:hypothetical protein